uniref:LigA n=1 Tax=Parastrongyloides trichosuri TaxID=131310 RepID=A0A0N5A0L7_PARTI
MSGIIRGVPKSRPPRHNRGCSRHRRARQQNHDRYRAHRRRHHRRGSPLLARPAAGAVRGADGLARAVHQPRAVVAGLQRPRAGGGREPAPPAAGATAVPVDLGQQPGRVLHDPRGGPEGAVPRAHPRRLARRPDPRRAAGAGQCRSRRPDGRTTAPVARPAQGDGGRRDRNRRARPHHQDRARASGARVPEPAVRRLDADGHRPGAPLPLPAQPGLLAGAEAAAQQRQPRPLRPGAGADAGAALLGAGDGRAFDAGTDALRLAGKPAAAVHRPHVPGLRDPGKGPVPP